MGDISGYLTNVSIITYVAVFLGGVATSFTPCVYPLLPIVASVIGSQAEKSKVRNLILSLSYVLGMAVTFSLLGLIAALTGSFFGEIQSSPVTHIVVGNIIILFALSLLDVFPLPVFLLSRTGLGKVKKGNSAFAVFLMGAVSGFIAVPCATAVLGALLVYVAAEQSVILGFSLLFTFAVGLGTVLVLIGVFAGIVAALPRFEKSMRVVQKIIAFAMIFLGEYLIFKAGMLIF